MIAKMKSNLSAKETLLYNDKEKSEIIFINNLTGENQQEVEKQMAARHQLFTGRAKNLTAHIMISPGIEDGKMLTRLDWKEIGNSFLQKANLSAYQSIAFLHKDKEHFHLHIVANRIDKNGKIYRNGNELVMSQRIGDEIAIERGLNRAAEISRERKLAREKGIVVNNEVGSVALKRKVVTNAAIKAWSTGKFDQANYFNEIKLSGFEVRLFFKKDHESKTTNELRGYAIGRKADHFINASQIGSEFTLRRLMQETPILSHQPLINNEQIKDSIRKDLQACFDKLVRTEVRFDPQQFLNEVRLKKNPVIEYHNKDTGKLRGYALGKDGFIFNASEIGSEFTLANLQKRFNELTLRFDPLKKVPEQKTRQPNDLNEEIDPGPGDQISKELKRTIDLTLISSDLKDLTSGHKYQSYNDFIKAVEGKGYHVHLRYDKGNLAGYSVHKGTEHYHDKEIENGRFSLDQLTKNGIFRPLSFRNSQEVKDNEIHMPSADASPIEGKLAPSNKPLDLAHRLFVEQEAQRKKESDRERISQIIANELRTHLHPIYNGVQPLDIEKFFSQLVADGYKLTRHFNKETGSLRGYSLKKYGFDFHASEIGREFTLKSIRYFQSECTRSTGIKSKMHRPIL